jgi:hypothetical protein
MTFEYVLEDTKLIQLDVIIANETMLYGSKGNNDGNDGAGQSRR